ncbi:MAG: PAS domain-containing hybrid sensor histidine kinase/response regulator [Thermodesulforhabdaceae bacterium]
MNKFFVTAGLCGWTLLLIVLGVKLSQFVTAHAAVILSVAVWFYGIGLFVLGIWKTGKDRINKRAVKSESLLDAVFKSVEDGISVLDKNLTVLYVNPTMEKWYSRNMPLVGKKCFTAYHRATEPCDPCPSLRAITTGKKEVEIVKGLPDSSIEWLEVYAYPVLDPGTNEIIGVSEFVRDITESVRREQALKKATDQLNALFQTMIEGVAFCQLVRDAQSIPVDYRIMKVNPQYEYMMGISDKETIGKLATEVYNTDMPPFFMEYLGIVMSKKPMEFETYVDTLQKYLHISAVPWEDDGFFTVISDLTERKKMELQIQRGQKLESLGLLAGGIAHDFNNILQIINGYADLAMQQLSSQHPLWEYLAYIRNAGNRAAELVQQILTFSKRGPSNPKTVNVNDAIKNLLSMLKRIIGEHIELQFHPTESIAPIEIDPAMFDQLIMNLCINARDAMPYGGKIIIKTQEITVREDYLEKYPWAVTGEYVSISIADTGVGISPDLIDSIFDPFFTTKDQGKGTGLGLATVYGIVKQHNGLINVCSEVGKGTTFKVFFPMSDKIIQESKTGSELRAFRGKETILLAEDNDEVRLFVKTIMENAGYKVIEAKDGVKAWELAVKYRNSIDLLILDVVMPGLGGLEVYKKLNSMNFVKPVIFVSGYSEDTPFLRDLPEMDRVVYMSKPFSSEALLVKVREQLSSSESSAGRQT